MEKKNVNWDDFKEEIQRRPDTIAAESLQFEKEETNELLFNVKACAFPFMYVTAVNILKYVFFCRQTCMRISVYMHVRVVMRVQMYVCVAVYA